LAQAIFAQAQRIARSLCQSSFCPEEAGLLVAMPPIQRASGIVALCLLAHVSMSEATTTLVNIRSEYTGEYLYEGVPTLDWTRRYVLTWIPKNEDPTVVTQYHFELTPLANGNFNIKSKYRDEYWYVGDPKLDSKRRHVLSWIPKNEDPTVVTQYQFEIIPLFNGKYIIKSTYTDEYVYVGAPKLDSTRHRVLTWIPKNEDPTIVSQYQFEIPTLGTALASLASVLGQSSASSKESQVPMMPPLVSSMLVGFLVGGSVAFMALSIYVRAGHRSEQQPPLLG